MKILLAAALALLPALPSLAAQSASCPDERASNVGAVIDGGSEVSQCGVRISLYGIEIAIGVVRCPILQTVQPAHGECLGETMEGAMCTKADDLEVRLLKCQCGPAAVFSTTHLLSNCNCQDMGTAGTIENFKTVGCVNGGGAGGS